MPGPGEFDIIRDYFATAPVGAGVVLGIGDDCALLEPPSQGLLATSVDTLVAGVHFPADADAALIAARALRVNLSDLAAMNARPLWFTLALTLPHNDPHWLREFSRGLLETARAFGISLVGGDTTRGPLSITIQVFGSCSAPLRRGGAGAGDRIFVSGALGAAAAALPVILGQRQVGEEARRAAESAYYLPAPQLELAAAIGGMASSALDISDGLLADLGHICAASGLDANIELERVPVARLAQQLAAGDALSLAASGGDDYQLCFTVPQARIAQLEMLCAERGFCQARQPVCIGSMIEGAGIVRCSLNGNPWQPRQSGYRHF